LALVICIVPSVLQAGFIVDSTHVIDYTGFVATPGQVVQITATGEIDMAYDNGHYVTNPDGTILVAPTGPVPGGGVYPYMINESPDHLPPIEGSYVNIAAFHGNDIGQLIGSPFGGLIAGFSSTLSPNSLSDFTDGFTFIGTSGSITAPVGAPYLFLSINDTYRSDNIGSYTATISSAQGVPAPSSLVLAVLGIGTGCVWRRLWWRTS
jgi:hypothetical protein